MDGKGKKEHEGRKGEKPEERGKRRSAEGEERKGKKKKHLHQIITTQAHDGTWSHEHIYKDKKEDMHTHPPVFAGTSQSMEDLHDHVNDHWGPQSQAEEETEEHTEPDQDDGVAREHEGEGPEEQ
jgi:hypothetical protein